jgi:hypothetical protein
MLEFSELKKHLRLGNGDIEQIMTNSFENIYNHAEWINFRMVIEIEGVF